MEKRNKLYSLLGLAMKARKLVSGEFQTEEAVKKKTARLVILAEDASDNTKKLFHDKCTFHQIPIFECGKKEDLGRAIGKDLRSSLAVCDEGFATAVMRQLESEK